VQGSEGDGSGADGGADSKGALGGGNRGGAPMQGGASSAPSAQNVKRRVDGLPANASPVDRLVAEGWDALDVKDLTTAEAKLKEALATAPTSAPALTGLGRVYVQSGRIDDALRSFGESIKVAPDYMPGWHYNGMAQLLAGSPREAVFSWEKIKVGDPQYFANNNLGQRVEVAKRMAQ
jgi:Flp pilus assembly protein TadD